MRLTTLLSLLCLLGRGIVSNASPTAKAKANGIRIPLTKRSTMTNDDGTVNIKALRNEITRVRSKLNRGFAAFEKNTGSIHPNDSRNSTKRETDAGTGAEPLLEIQETLWYGSITVGTPPSPFTVSIVDFDTGSSDLFLPASTCNVNCEGHTLWKTSSSSTIRSLGRSFRLAFAGPSVVSGTLVQDTVDLGGLTATEQDVGAATRYPTAFAIDVFPPDGRLGMAFPSISGFGANPVFHTLVAQGKTLTSQFAFKISTSGSELLLGGVNPGLFTGSLTQIPVSPVAFWQIALTSVNVNGVVVTGGQSIVDTAAGLLLGPADSVAQFYANIPGARDASNTLGTGFFTLPCTSVPTVSLKLGGRSFPISADSLNLGQVSPGSPRCIGGVASVDFSGMWILGDVFLRNVYSGQ
ncbi:hypothetical protein ONZ45_g16604 [Pleurotus djamor]|nr:hypothetical protein ONZ45_g16604 [Pleurotus djamor]